MLSHPVCHDIHEAEFLQHVLASHGDDGYDRSVGQGCTGIYDVRGATWQVDCPWWTMTLLGVMLHTRQAGKRSRKTAFSFQIPCHFPAYSMRISMHLVLDA